VVNVVLQRRNISFTVKHPRNFCAVQLSLLITAIINKLWHTTFQFPNYKLDKLQLDFSIISLMRNDLNLSITETTVHSVGRMFNKYSDVTA